MNFLPIWAVVLRHTRLILHDLNRIVIILYWPLLDVLIWGFLGRWMQNIQGNNNLEYVFLLAILLWQVCNRTCLEVIMSLMEEFWSSNMINMFASPIKLVEWFAGIILFIIFLVAFIVIYCVAMMKLFYGMPILGTLANFIIFAPALFLSGLWLGFMVLPLIIYFGKRAQEFAFVTGWLFAPFCGAFYPIDVLPAWAQKISHVLPMTYVFQGMREFILNNVNPAPNLLISCALSLTYGTICLIFFCYMFNKSKNKGFARLMD